MSAFFRRSKPKPPPEPETPSFQELTETAQTTLITGDREFDTSRVRLLIDSLREVSSEQDSDALLVTMVDRAIATASAERGLLLTPDKNGVPVLAIGRSASGKNLPQGARWTTQVVQDVLARGEAICQQEGDDQDFDPSQSMINLDIRSVMCVPLQLSDQLRGALYVDARASERPFAKTDLRYFQAFADMLKIIWANRAAMEQRILAERMARDLALVRDIQDYLLPNGALEANGYTLVGKVIPADEAGGDYFDYFPTSQGRLAVAVGDVSGHGAGPALIMSGARAYLRSYCQRGGSPAETLSHLNGHLSDDMDDDKFMSMVLGVLSPETHAFEWCNAGHPLPLLVHADGSVDECATSGMALGVDEDCTFDRHPVFELAVGDTLVMYTDGVIELRQGGDEQYGMARLTESVRSHVGSDARTVLDAIIADALSWSGSEHPGQDDVTVAVLRRNS
ncbi:MAG: sigma-B regulation protein RsbU (phosphoserine phosphatase) [Pseudohongiellaceae bacterium]|jgi:sigma-B regulation protein RsbU (phosphoserine phosphatase)